VNNDPDGFGENRDLIWGTVLEFSWMNWGKRRQFWITTACIVADIRAKHIPNTGQVTFRLSQLTRLKFLVNRYANVKWHMLKW